MRSGTERFGARLRSRREKKDLSLRELARQAGISAAFLSRIECGKEKPPAESKVRAIAKVLCCDAEMLLASSGRLPRDVLKVIQKHPCEYFALIRASKGLTAERLGDVQQQLSRKGKL